MFYFVRLAFEKALAGVVGSFVKSPIERDFGEPSEDDIVAPSANYYIIGQLEYLETHLVNVFAALDGLSHEKFEKLHTRLWEIPKGRDISYRYQVREPGGDESVELQLRVQKHMNNITAIIFKSSTAVIRIIEPLMPKQVDQVPPYQG